MQVTQHRITRLLRMQLPEIVYRGKQETMKLVDRVRTARVPASVDADAQRLRTFTARCRDRFFPGVFDPAVAPLLESAYAEESQAVLIRAHHAFHGRFDLLGYKSLEFGRPIDWYLDPISGRRAPPVHWSRIDPLDCATVGDSKVTWELNRHQWLVALGQAWQLTRDERYANTVVQTILRWLAANPVGIGINWASSLEVAFRLIAWCWAVLLISDSEMISAEAFRQIEVAAADHASHIERYLSYYFSPNTHLTGEALGLLYAAVAFPQMRNANRYRTAATRILVGEIESQVLADGVYFERSTCYQRYTADIYLHFLILARRAGIALPPIVSERLRLLLHSLLAFTGPNGLQPEIGDGDSGLLLPLSAIPPNDPSPTFSTAAVVFRDPVYARAAKRLAPDTLWLLGTSAAEAFDSLSQQPPAGAASRVFPVGGFVTMRSSWDRDAHALTFDAGPLGCHYSAGHGHADLLSVQCFAFGEPYIVDAGTCCYTADRDLRDYFRSTRAHSTVVVDGQSQAEPSGPFSWKNRCAARLLQWRIDDELTYADAYSDAYKRLTDPVSHRRRIVFVDRRYWIVVDDICGSKEHQIDVRYQFAAMRVEAGKQWVRATTHGKQGLLVAAAAAVPLQTSLRAGLRDPMEGWISRAYGRMERAPALVYSAATTLPLRVVTILYPAEDVMRPPADFEIVRDASGRPTGVRNATEEVMFDDDIDVRNRRNS